MLVLYIAGPYSAKNGRTVEHHISVARAVAANLWRAGFAVICPHLNTAHFDRLYPEIKYEVYIKGDLEIVRRVDGLVMLPNWRESEGAREEFKLARQLNKPIWEWPTVAGKNDVELKLRRIA